MGNRNRTGLKVAATGVFLLALGLSYYGMRLSGAGPSKALLFAGVFEVVIVLPAIALVMKHELSQGGLRALRARRRTKVGRNARQLLARGEALDDLGRLWSGVLRSYGTTGLPAFRGLASR
jgi:hypothetical protein